MLMFGSEPVHAKSRPLERHTHTLIHTLSQILNKYIHDKKTKIEKRKDTHTHTNTHSHIQTCTTMQTKSNPQTPCHCFLFNFFPEK